MRTDRSANFREEEEEEEDESYLLNCEVSIHRCVWRSEKKKQTLVHKTGYKVYGNNRLSFVGDVHFFGISGDFHYVMNAVFMNL